MKRDNLNTMFGNILSQAAGFSPEILAISHENGKVRAAFSAKNKSSQDQEVEEESLIQKDSNFFWLIKSWSKKTKVDFMVQ